MKAILPLTALLCFMAVPAMAQQFTVNAVCQQIEPAPIDGAEYVPGVDAEGKPVVGADLNQPVKAIQYPIVVPIEIDILKFLELDVSADLQNSTEVPAQIAYVKLYEDGRVEYNGRDISEDVAYNCVEKLPEPETAQPEAPAPAEAAVPTKTPVAATPAVSPPAVTAPQEAPKADGQVAPKAVPSVQVPPASIVAPAEVKPAETKTESKSTDVKEQ
jgi:hypothetical protein